jgi:glycerol uptake facilitator-like aquaporin
MMLRRLTAECLGTFWLVFGGCGSAALAAATVIGILVEERHQRLWSVP